MCTWTENGKMRMKHCGWKIANDKYADGKLLARGIILRCFLTVLVVNKPGQLILNQGREPRFQLFIYSRNIYLITKQIEIFLRRSKKRKRPDRIITNYTFLLLSDSVVLLLYRRTFALLPLSGASP